MQINGLFILGFYNLNAYLYCTNRSTNFKCKTKSYIMNYVETKTLIIHIFTQRQVSQFLETSGKSGLLVQFLETSRNQNPTFHAKFQSIVSPNPQPRMKRKDFEDIDDDDSDFIFSSPATKIRRLVNNTISPLIHRCSCRIPNYQCSFIPQV